MNRINFIPFLFFKHFLSAKCLYNYITKIKYFQYGMNDIDELHCRFTIDVLQSSGILSEDMKSSLAI